MTRRTAHSAPTSRPKAYSYVRFSTPEQAKGDSFRRQTEAAERYAALQGLEMDRKFTFHDLGMSAYRGRNTVDGMLGEFLAYVRSGDIPKGSFLLVENLDRVSRENVWDALDALKDIAKAGVIVVTLSDGKQYSYDSLRQNPMDMMLALLMFMRANDESATKGRRVSEAWATKRRNAATKPLSALCPGWLRLREDKTGFDELPERGDIVRRVFAMTLAGKGQHAIAETFNREGVPVFGRGTHWHRSYIKKMLSDASTIGSFTPHRIEVVGGKKQRVPTEAVEGYFPPVINREVFDRVNALSSGRAVGETRGGGMANILAGLAKCPRCEATMTRVNKGGKKGGKPYLVCTTAKAGAGCEYRQVRIGDVEEAIVRNAGWLNASLPATDEALQTQYEEATLAEMAVNDEIEKLVEAIGQAGHSPALIDRLRRNEAAREDIKRTMADLERRIADTLTNRVQATAAQFADAAEAEEPRDVALINATLRQLFTKVDVDWPSGTLVFHWKHAPAEATSISYAWPKDV